MNPSAVQRTASGLYIPKPAFTPREVWPKADGKLLDRCALMLKRHGVKLQLACGEPSCGDRTLKASRDLGGDLHLTCGHRVNVLTRAF